MVGPTPHTRTSNLYSACCLSFLNWMMVSINQIDTQIIVKVMQGSSCQTARRLIIFRRTCIRQPFYFGCTCTPGHLILGILVKFSGVYTPVRPLTEALRIAHCWPLRKNHDNRAQHDERQCYRGHAVTAPIVASYCSYRPTSYLDK